MSANQAWIVAVAVLALLAGGMGVALWLRRPGRPAGHAPLPGEWRLAPRPVFSTDERRVHRLLREALPHCVVLAKLPIVRFCQPIEPNQVRYWYDLLGPNHVAFAVCSPNGRVLAAIDLDNGRGDASRSNRIKQAVLHSLRVRYLRVSPDQPPSIAELQMLAPPRAPVPHALNQARDTLASTVATRRAQRGALWQDSSQFPDSFFAPDTRSDGFGATESGGLYGRSGPASRFDISGPGALADTDLGGVVVDNTTPFGATRH